jgi:hypothetical protein
LKFLYVELCRWVVRSYAGCKLKHLLEDLVVPNIFNISNCHCNPRVNFIVIYITGDAPLLEDPHIFYCLSQAFLLLAEALSCIHFQTCKSLQQTQHMINRDWVSQFAIQHLNKAGEMTILHDKKRYQLYLCWRSRNANAVLPKEVYYSCLELER